MSLEGTLHLDAVIVVAVLADTVLRHSLSVVYPDATAARSLDVG